MTRKPRHKDRVSYGVTMTLKRNTVTDENEWHARIGSDGIGTNATFPNTAKGLADMRAFVENQTDYYTNVTFRVLTEMYG